MVDSGRSQGRIVLEVILQEHIVITNLNSHNLYTEVTYGPLMPILRMFVGIIVIIPILLQFAYRHSS